MRALVIQADDQSLKVVNHPLPVLKENQIMIRVKAIGVNRPDIYQRKGNYPAPPGVDPDIPGLEIAGIVESVSGDDIPWSAGQEVCALVAGGGYAEYVAVDFRQVLPLPDGYSFAEAAGLCETYFTVWSNIMDRGHFQQGETVLIHGGSSGIGVSAIQLVKALGGKVIVTAGTREKCDACLSLGADLAINYHEEDFETVIRDGGLKADIILDMVGGDYTPRNLRILNVEGRLVIINAMQGRMAEVDLLRIMRNRLVITGSTLRARDAGFKVQIRDALRENVWPLLASGVIRPVIDQILPFEQAMKAHQLMESSTHIGKLILRVD